MTRRLRRLLLMSAALVLTASTAMATPFTITASLTGDGRPLIADNLNVDVTVTGDTTSAVTNWLIDLDMAATHSSAFLGEFGFNLVGLATDYTISALNLPYTVAANDDLQGSGNMFFLRTLSDPTGNTNDATNGTSLTFTVTKGSGNFLVSDFTGALVVCSNDVLLGCGQMGAHLQALTASGANTATSGVVLGRYVDGTPTQTAAVPEPASLLLLGGGLVGLAARARRKRQQQP